MSLPPFIIDQISKMTDAELEMAFNTHNHYIFIIQREQIRRADDTERCDCTQTSTDEDSSVKYESGQSQHNGDKDIVIS